jgi:hypothetical protein
MVGGTLYFLDSGGTYRSEYITASGGATNLTIGTARTISASTTYVLVYGGNRTSNTAAQIFQNTTDSTSAFQIQSLTTADVLFRADTTNNRLYVGNSTASAGTDTTLLVVDNATTSNLPTGVEGGLAYDSTLDRLKVYENSGWTIICTVANSECAGTGSDLQGAYDASSTPATITTSSGTKSVIVKAGVGFDQTGLFQIQNANGGTILAADTTNNKLVVTGDINLDQVTAPTAPTVATGAAGSLSNTYYYVIAYVTASGETNYGAVSASVTPSSQQVSLTNIPVSASSLVTARKVYRSTSSSGPFQLVDTGTCVLNDNTTTTCTDDDTSLGAYASNDNKTASLQVGGSRVLTVNSAQKNTWLGISTGATNRNGIENTGIGYEALSLNTTGSYNTATGRRALYNNTTGEMNTAFGSSMGQNTTGDYNSALGYGAGSYSQTGSYNLFLGNWAGFGNGVTYTGSDNNTLVGARSGYYLSSSADNNTFLGESSGRTSTTANANTVGSGNTYLGANSGAGVASAASLQNTSTLGVNSVVSSNNTVVLGCTASVNGCSASGSVVSIGSKGYGTNSADSTLNLMNVGSTTYSTGTISTSGSSTTVTGSGTTFNSGMVGGTLYFLDSGGTYRSEYITASGGATNLTIGTARTITASTAYVLVYGGNRTSSTGAQILQNTTDSTSAFKVQSAAGTDVVNIDTTNSNLSVRGVSSDATIGSELLSGNCSGTNWSGTGSGPYTHASGSVVDLTCTISGGVTAGATYQIIYSATPSNSNTVITANIGGVTGQSTRGTVVTQTQLITATNTNNPTFSINTSTDTGTISSISFKLVTLAKSALTVLNQNGSSSVSALEVRTSTLAGNTMVGYGTGQANVSGTQATGFGYQALQSNTTGSQITAFGYQALQNNTTGAWNTALGSGTLTANTIGANNTAIGGWALHSNSNGGDNVAIGLCALCGNLSGSYNMAIGQNALLNNSTGSYSVAIGYSALNSAGGTSASNIAIGHEVLRNTSIASNNVSIGHQAGYNNSTGSSNVLLGYQAGYGSGGSYTSSDSNVLIGYQSGYALGSNADFNTGLGHSSLLANTTGLSNVAIGHGALAGNTTGGYNVALGDNAGWTSDGNNKNTVGNYNSFLGYGSGPGVLSATNMQGGTAVGSNAVVSSNYTVALGCSDGLASCGTGSSAGKVSIASKGYGTLASNTTVNALTIGATTYVTGTISTSGSSTTVTGSGTTFTQAMVGGTIYFIDNSNTYRGEYITASGSATNLTIGTARNITASTAYVLVYGGSRTSNTGAQILQNTTDSTAAFQVQNAAANQLFVVNSTGGTVSTVLSGTASTTAVCSSLANATGPTANTVYELRDCSGAPAADYAEQYPVATGIEYGDIVSMGTNMVNTYDETDGVVDWTKLKGQITQLVKSGTPYQKNTIGIVSNNYNNFSSTGYNIKPEDNPMPVALNGRVPVKIASTSGDIQPGDYLTTSTESGKAMKATGAGYVIGKALAGWTSASGDPTVMVYVEPGYYEGPSAVSYIQNGGNANLSNLTVTGTADFANLNASGTSNINVLVVQTVTVSGNLTVQGLTKVQDIEVGGHIITSGNTPVTVAQAALGLGGAVLIDGNDTAGTITLTTGATGLAAGDLGKINFHKVFTKTPRIVISAQDDASEQVRIFPSAKATDSFMLKAGQTLAPNTTYTFDYFIVE